MKHLLILSCLVLFACRGPQGDPGNTGAQGSQGIQGSQGLQGPTGLNGSTITLVQFCPGTPSYPSTFPEIGMCINNKLYAVYSANDGFLTLIPPGVYHSNAIGSSCNFTILPNCGISN